ncbi:MAG: hypothetical protein WCC74_03455 [Minisyncoccia bacterium]
MKNKQKGFVIPLLIGIIAVLIIGGGVYIYTNKKVAETPVAVQNTATTTSAIKDWKTYTNKKFGYQIKYPNDWIYDVNLFDESNFGEGGIVFCPPEFQDLNSTNGLTGLKGGCKVGKTNGGSISPEAPIALFQYNSAQNYDCSHADLGSDKEGKYCYNLVLTDKKYSSVYSQIFTTFKFTSTSTQPSITVLSPNGGEAYKVGSQQVVTWNAPTSTKTVRIFLESISTHYAGGGVGGYIPDVHIILAQDALNSGSYTTNIPDVTTGKYSVLIEGIDNSGKPVVLSDSSDNYFTITSANSNQTLTTIELSVWLDVNSFNLTSQTFQAVNIFDFNACNNPKNPDPNACDRVKNGVKNIKTNNSTIYYRQSDSIKEYHDFNWLYSTMKNWIGPSWSFTIKGVTQSDGSILASEIYYKTQ